MMKKTHLMFFVAAGLLSGCDVDLTGSEKEQALLARERQQEEERLRQELDARRAAMKTFLEGTVRRMKERSDECRRGLDALRADAAGLSRALDAAMSGNDGKGDDLKYETKVLRAVRNPDVNGLAEKYLSFSFSTLIPGYIDRVRAAREAASRYEAAVREADGLYNDAVSESGKWASATKEQREAETRRIEREIDELEKSREALLEDIRNLTRHRMVGNFRQERERQESAAVMRHKMGDLDAELRKRRWQIDLLKHPVLKNKLVSRAVEDAQYRQNRAVILRREAMNDADRRLKPRESVLDVVSEFERSTLARLRGELADRIAAGEKELARVKARIRVADESLLAVPVATLAELDRMKRALHD